MFSANTEYWRPLFEGKGLPVDFVLDWIEVESGGNPCDLEQATGKDEISLLQLMVPNDTDLANTDEASLRAACVPGSNQLARELTQADLDLLVSSSVDYVNALRDHAHQLLQAAGTDWDESTPDFWALVKLLHSLPSLTKYLQVAANALGRGPASWAEFSSYVPSSAGYDHWMNVSANVGAYAAGFSPPLLRSTWAVLGIGLAGLAVGVWLYERRASRRIGLIP